MMIPITMICIDKNNENNHKVIMIMIMTIMVMIGTIGVRKKNNYDDSHYSYLCISL